MLPKLKTISSTQVSHHHNIAQACACALQRSYHRDREIWNENLDFYHTPRVAALSRYSSFVTSNVLLLVDDG